MSNHEIQSDETGYDRFKRLSNEKRRNGQDEFSRSAVLLIESEKGAVGDRLKHLESVVDSSVNALQALLGRSVVKQLEVDYSPDVVSAAMMQFIGEGAVYSLLSQFPEVQSAIVDTIKDRVEKTTPDYAAYSESQRNTVRSLMHKHLGGGMRRRAESRSDV